MLKSVKTVLIILGVLAVLLCVAGIILFVILPVTYDIDETLIRKNPGYSVKAEMRDGYRTLYKADAAGNISEEPFKIQVFTDLHLDTYKEKGETSLEFMIMNIVNEKPDLVVFNGDIVTSALNGKRARQFADIMDRLGVYWTYALGNHEGDQILSISRKKMIKTFAESEFCLCDTEGARLADGTRVWGAHNEVINILGADESIIQSLYIMDGGSDMSESDAELYAKEAEGISHKYDYLKPDQIEWYKENVTRINGLTGTTVKSVIFDHIPLRAFETAYNSVTGETEADPLSEPSYNVPDSEGTELLFGKRREGICFEAHDSGMFDAILEAGSTQAFIAGHDHINDFCLEYKDIILAYCCPGGYSSYNLFTKNISRELIKGYSVISIGQDGSFSLEHRRNEELYPELSEKALDLYS